MDVLIDMFAAQLGIPKAILAQLKAMKVEMLSAGFDNGFTSLTLIVKQPTDMDFPVYLRLPTDQLMRLPKIYAQAVKVANH